MATVTIKWARTTASFPAGTIGGNWRTRVSKPADPSFPEQEIQTDPANVANGAVFSLGAGDYSIKVARLNDGGNVLGTEISSSLSIAAPPPPNVSIEIPVSPITTQLS